MLSLRIMEKAVCDPKDSGRVQGLGVGAPCQPHSRVSCPATCSKCARGFSIKANVEAAGASLKFLPLSRGPGGFAAGVSGLTAKCVLFIDKKHFHLTYAFRI